MARCTTAQRESFENARAVFTAARTIHHETTSMGAVMNLITAVWDVHGLDLKGSHIVMRDFVAGKITKEEAADLLDANVDAYLDVLNALGERDN